MGVGLAIAALLSVASAWTVDDLHGRIEAIADEIVHDGPHQFRDCEGVGRLQRLAVHLERAVAAEPAATARTRSRLSSARFEIDVAAQGYCAEDHPMLYQPGRGRFLRGIRRMRRRVTRLDVDGGAVVRVDAGVAADEVNHLAKELPVGITPAGAWVGIEGGESAGWNPVCLAAGAVDQELEILAAVSSTRVVHRVEVARRALAEIRGPGGLCREVVLAPKRRYRLAAEAFHRHIPPLIHALRGP